MPVGVTLTVMIFEFALPEAYGADLHVCSQQCADVLQRSRTTWFDTIRGQATPATRVEDFPWQTCSHCSVCAQLVALPDVCSLHQGLTHKQSLLDAVPCPQADYLSTIHAAVVATVARRQRRRDLDIEAWCRLVMALEKDADDCTWISVNRVLEMLGWHPDTE